MKILLWGIAQQVRHHTDRVDPLKLQIMDGENPADKGISRSILIFGLQQ